MKIRCEIETSEKENENGIEAPCTTAVCGRCGHITESWGDGEASMKRCLVLMREECPNGESNFYVDQAL